MRYSESMVLAVLALSSMTVFSAAQPGPDPRAKVSIDDFETYEVGGLPTEWQYVEDRTFVPLTDTHMDPDEYFVIKQEGGNKFVRSFTNGEAHRIFLANGERFDWDLTEHPRLRWRWRAMELPEGAREDQDALNDTGGAVYVTFSRNWLGMPRSIKYTYSSTLPVGTVVTYGRLKVLVVASGMTGGLGEWVTVERNVVADYRRLFGDEPEDRPLTLFIWNDSDTTGDTAVVDFDDITLLG